MSRCYLWVYALLLYSSTLHAQLTLEVQAGGHDRIDCPVTFSLPSEWSDTQHFELVRQSDQKQIPVQRLDWAASPRIIWMIHDRLAAGEKRTYTLNKANAAPRFKQVVRCEDDGASITVKVGDSPVLQFNHATVEAPEGIDPIYRRSGYIHPVFSPQGNIVTGDFESDHAHQHGIFNAWVNATFMGKPVDFWNQAKGLGDVEFKAILNRRESGPVFAQFTAKLTHVAIRDGERVPAIEETWQVRVFHARDPFLFEIYSSQSTTTEKPVQVNEYHYGGFGIRGPSEWLIAKGNKENSDNTRPHQDPVAAGDFLTSENRTRADGNHTRARWVEMHGPIGSQHAGIIVMGANNNFRAPQPVRLHPDKPYFCFAPMALGSFSLEHGDKYTSRFRFATHDGAQNARLAERLWQDFAHPPKVVVTANSLSEN